jgi:hypothetical protein
VRRGAGPHEPINWAHCAGAKWRSFHDLHSSESICTNAPRPPGPCDSITPAKSFNAEARASGSHELRSLTATFVATMAVST